MPCRSFGGMGKMTTLTIEHLSAYLPYGVNLSVQFFGDTRTIVPLVTHNPYSDMRLGVSVDQCQHYNAKLILRPLSQLTVPITHNGETFEPYMKLKWAKEYADRVVSGEYPVLTECVYSDVCKLIEWHFDVFGLIETGLAVAMNPDGTI